MKVEYSWDFEKTVRKLSGKVLASVKEAILEVRNASSVNQLTNCNPLAMQHDAFRLKTVFLHPLLASPFLEPLPGFCRVVRARASPRRLSVDPHPRHDLSAFPVKTLPKPLEFRLALGLQWTFHVHYVLRSVFVVFAALLWRALRAFTASMEIRL